MSEGMIIRRGGGASLKATDALLRVQAPAGSTVTITKGSVSKTDLGHENADHPTVYDYYFIIHQSQFDSVTPWTVTATLITQTVTQTIIINAADEYDLLMSYNVPAEYQAVEYLESTGSQYIKVSTTRGDINARLQFTTNDTAGMNGGGSGGYSHDSRLAIGKDTKWSFLSGAAAETTSDVIADTLVHDLRLTFSGGNGTLYLDNTAILTKSAPFSGTASHFCLFAYVGYASSSPSYYAKERIMHFEIEGKHDMYPCYRKADGVAGMWDKTTQTFRTNNGSGTFIVGDDI